MPTSEQGHVGPLPLSMVSSKGAGSAINGFIEGHQGGREQGTPHTQRDMAYHLLFVAKKEWQVFIYFQIRLGKKLFDSGACTLADS